MIPYNQEEQQAHRPNLPNLPKFKKVPASPIDEYEHGCQPFWTFYNTDFKQSTYILKNIQSCLTNYTQNLYPGPDHTVIVREEQSVTHVSAYGDVLSQLSMYGMFQWNMWAEMLTPELVLLVDVGNMGYELTQINLVTNQSIRAVFQDVLFDSHAFNGEVPVVFCFPKTNILSICCPTHETKEVRILVYEYPFKRGQGNIRPISDRKIKLFNQFFYLKFLKLNESDLIGWISSQSSEESSISVLIHDIRQNISTIYKFPVEADEQYQSHLITDLCEIKPGVMYLQLKSINSTKNIEKWDNFLWNYKKQNDCRRLKFDIPHEHRIQILGNFRNLSYPGKYPQHQVIYYVDLTTEWIMAIEEVNKKHTDFPSSRFSYAPELQYTFSDFTSEEGDSCMKVEVRKIQWSKLDLGLVVAYWLEEIVDDCDEDLIFYIRNLILSGDEQHK